MSKTVAELNVEIYDLEKQVAKLEATIVREISFFDAMLAPPQEDQG